MRPATVLRVLIRGGIAAGLLGGLVGCDSDNSALKSEDVAPSGQPGAAAVVETPVRRVALVWPVPNRAYFEGADFAAFIQPTESGLIESGLYGSTRSNGRQFHEGIDLFPLMRDARGEALDDVFAAMSGVVRHVSARAGASSYGRYVVLEHPEESPPVYTLYAHLENIDPSVRPDAEIGAGERIGRMGRSAGGYTIPRERAHLHFEIGLRMTERFQTWYDGRKFGSRNEHGLYNGMNLMGLDPLDFYARKRAGDLRSLDDVFRATPAAVVLRIANADEPDFVLRYPSLRKRAVGLRGGWEIELSATGAPLRWREISLGEFGGWNANEVRVLRVEQELLNANRGRELVRTVRGQLVPGRDLRTVLEQLFAWKG